MVSNFFIDLLNKLRGIRKNLRIFPSKNSTIQNNGTNTNTFFFGEILSGSYMSNTGKAKDPHPTILYLGTFAHRKTGNLLVYGINLHFIDSTWLINQIILWRKSNIVWEPVSFCNMLKTTAPAIYKAGFKTYYLNGCNFKPVSPGLSGIKVNNCYSITDPRDKNLLFLNNSISNPQNDNNFQINKDKLSEQISNALNNFKIW